MSARIINSSILPSLLALSIAGGLPCVSAATIQNVVETGGDNEPTDTITAKWTGQSWTVGVAGEPVPGAVVGATYTVGVFSSTAPAFVDRAHRYMDDPGTDGGAALPIPAYLLGQEYILSGNDNRDNGTYKMDVTVGSAATVYLLVDNRLGDANNANPATFDATHMQWVLTDGWVPSSTGHNRFSNGAIPDEVGIDEGADGTINQWYSVYRKDFSAGSFSLLQADNTGQNMYGVIVVPEPATLALVAIGLTGLMLRRRR